MGPQEMLILAVIQYTKKEWVMPTPRIMFDHDGRHPLIYMYEPPIYREELEAAVDELAGTPVEALMLMLGDIRSLLYETRAGELWGQNVEQWPHTIWRRAHQNFTALIQRGEDPPRRRRELLLPPLQPAPELRGARKNFLLLFSSATARRGFC